MTGFKLSPFQRIVAVHFGIPTKFRFTAAQNRSFSGNPSDQWASGFFQIFSFGTPGFTSGPVTQIDGDFGTGDGNYQFGTDDHPTGDPDYFALGDGATEFSAMSSDPSQRQLLFGGPNGAIAAIPSGVVMVLDIPGIGTFRTDDANYDSSSGARWTNVDAGLAFAPGTQYDGTWKPAP